MRKGGLPVQSVDSWSGFRMHPIVVREAEFAGREKNSMNAEFVDTNILVD